MTKLNYLQFISLSGPKWSANGTASYNLHWGSAFRDLARRAAEEQWPHREAAIPNLAWLGLGGIFFGCLRRTYPKAFLLTNVATTADSISFVSRSLNSSVNEILAVYPHAKIRWDYGWGLGGSAMKDSPAHVLEVADLAPLMPGIMGLGPAEMSFVLMLASKQTSLEDVCSTLERIPSEREWDSGILATVALFGFPHEEVMYTIKTREGPVMRLLTQALAVKR